MFNIKEKKEIKKIYMNPEIEIIKIQTQKMLAESSFQVNSYDPENDDTYVEETEDLI